ncbi:hypothetical protein LWI29_019505 [Acer saccharum]|uniref:RNase H type-1 domain-containing protein n=1 Tax=Acer saccharum TaxID=4024 RepID=A0AA39RI86_ACESA|nr:hypothetical protein LWI29_019505 [Acer saccharum]
MHVDVGSSKYGAGIVFIHEHEIGVEAVAMVFQGVVSVEIVEAKTSFEGFAMAVRLGRLPLCIELDALGVVNLCNKVESSNGDRDNIINDIVLLLHSFCDIKLVHIPRASNSVAHPIFAVDLVSWLVMFANKLHAK